ncbi:PKD domain-containing protein [Candidatus Parcubacteria bacterium]|nr:PKD domain-containing protein [Candidatus Parcubacteria bacterium]
MLRGIFRKYLPIFVLIFLPLLSYADVSKIVFTTDPQTAKPGEISGTMTIQTQDSSGVSAKVTETVDVEFKSTSATGEFLSPTTESAVSKTISTGSANKNFRYRDASLGSFTITINATGRASGTKWSANQIFNVSNIIQTPAPTSTDDTDTEDDTDDSTEETDAGGTSTHFSAAPVVTLKSSIKYKIGAGRSRLASTDTPIEFRAVSNIEETHNTRYTWSFGDGTIGYGSVIGHSYSYPGEYVVVLNATSPAGQAVSRSEVRVVPAEIAITYASGDRVEITNQGKTEMNLFGRALVSDGRTFVFPEDTIIKAGKKISFPNKVTNLSPQNMGDVSLALAGNIAGKNITVSDMVVTEPKIISAEDQARIESIYDQILTLELQQIELRKAEALQTASPISALENFSSSAEIGSSTEAKAARGWLNTIKQFFGFR